MSFMRSYKHLEKLCGEVLNDQRCISAYIDEMENTPSGAFYVSCWNDDLKRLKHYRWARNQISHNPDCDETNMCGPGDTLWLDQFHARIMNQTDPLTLYRKTAGTHTVPKSKPAYIAPTATSNTHNIASNTKSSTHNIVSRRTLFYILYLLIAILIILSVIAVLYCLQ